LQTATDPQAARFSGQSAIGPQSGKSAELDAIGSDVVIAIESHDDGTRERS
jgi:hypothetical protein